MVDHTKSKSCDSFTDNIDTTDTDSGMQITSNDFVSKIKCNNSHRLGINLKLNFKYWVQMHILELKNMYNILQYNLELITPSWNSFCYHIYIYSSSISDKVMASTSCN